jgi:two-component system, NtrC family, nitrogen regulation response regulator NtrX
VKTAMTARVTIGIEGYSFKYMKNEIQVLICDDDPIFHMALKHTLKLKGGYQCRSAYNSDEGEAILKNRPVDIILLDVQMRTGDEGLRSIERFRAVDPDAAIIMSSGRTDFETVRQALVIGANDYVAKDSDPGALLHVLERVLEKRRIVQRRAQQDYEVSSLQRQHILVGESRAMQTLRRTIERVRQSPANVLIFGETGAGKEVVARQLRMPLEDGSLAPFVAIDSSTIQSNTAESLLFGHEKGAFTGAERQVKGVFEEADGGVVYFDEIANMPLDIQAKLLRVLQEREFSRMGSTRIIESSFRVICATNKDLELMSEKGLFKDDLYQRLNVLPIIIPPLRDRTEDIPQLVAHFLRKQPGGAGLSFTPGAFETLQGYAWPGNIRELGNLIAYVAAMTDGNEVDTADLPPKVRDAASRKASSTAPRPEGPESAETLSSFYEHVAGFERKLLTGEYERHTGNISRMAMKLGMDRSHLYTKLREHGIHPTKKTESPESPETKEK